MTSPADSAKAAAEAAAEAAAKTGPIREGIFALPPIREGERGAAGVAFAGEQDPSVPNEAGEVAAFSARLLERAYPGEEMARSVRRLRLDEFFEDRADAAPRHEGASGILAALAHFLRGPWRGTGRPGRIARHILLRRARAGLRRAGLREDPEDPEVQALARSSLGYPETGGGTR